MNGVSYLKLSDYEFKERINALYEKLRRCDLCPNNCHVDRLNGEIGLCKTLDKPIISSYGPHFGEERPLVGRFGSGTVFFTHCNLRCEFCQNYEISQQGEGFEVTEEALAAIFLTLQQQGCHNINLVSPTHQVPFIVKAIYLASKEGLNVPIVYNTGGYDSVETLRLLDGIIDIYMPDIKYMDRNIGLKLSKVKDYPHYVKLAVKEMHRQVGDLIIEDNIARRGLLIRHLVLPNNMAQTKEVLRFIAEEVSPNTYVNIMDQYRPCFNAYKYTEISRRISEDEFIEAIKWAKEFGLTRIDDIRFYIRWGRLF